VSAVEVGRPPLSRRSGQSEAGSPPRAARSGHAVQIGPPHAFSSATEGRHRHFLVISLTRVARCNHPFRAFGVARVLLATPAVWFSAFFQPTAS